MKWDDMHAFAAATSAWQYAQRRTTRRLDKNESNVHCDLIQAGSSGGEMRGAMEQAPLSQMQFSALLKFVQKGVAELMDLHKTLWRAELCRWN
jgi:hypothetical protein